MQLFTEVDHKAVSNINRIALGFIARMRVRKIIYQKYTRFYDSQANKFYWLDNVTQKTTWKVSKFLMKQEIPMPLEDQMLYASMQRIKELEEKLQAKEKEIKDVRLKRFEELEPLVIADRVQNAKALKRSKDMDTWTIDELAAFFTELKMDEYIPFLYKNK